jgi:hypothetical protein
MPRGTRCCIAADTLISLELGADPNIAVIAFTVAVPLAEFVAVKG